MGPCDCRFFKLHPPHRPPAERASGPGAAPAAAAPPAFRGLRLSLNKLVTWRLAQVERKNITARPPAGLLHVAHELSWPAASRSLCHRRRRRR